MSRFRADFSECPRGLDAGAYVLSALASQEAADYAAHLEECGNCRSEVYDLRAVVDTLPIAAPQSAAPPALKGRLMAIVNAEAELLRAAGPEADAAPASRASRRRWLPSFSMPMRPAFVGALACGLLGVGVVGGIAVESTGGPETRTVVAQTTGKAKAQLEVTGDKASLRVTGAPSLKEGRIYQVWFDRGDGQKRPTHTLFNVRSDGRATVAIDESVEGVAQILVTEEDSGGSLAPSSDPVISADLA
ncbi:MAG: anti-sigma factor [Solirubrobacterales bacterium]|nr:anti-sigma factor [Solirubrobacterales bacterium]